MNDTDPTTEAKRWLRYAREDLSAAQTMIAQESGLARHVCWLAQQAAEKAFKAGLVLLQIDFPKTHDLDALRNLLPDDWQLKDSCPDLADLAEWAVESRYPGNWPDATDADATAAVEQAAAVVQSVADDLGSRGVGVDQ